jgi:pimeloyl-ACP methyl ester carboxylesterase
MRLHETSLALGALLVAIGCASQPSRPATAARRTVDVGGVSLAYMEKGQGEPVVLVHGASCDSRVFAAQVDGLSARFRVIAYDRRYHGSAAVAVKDTDYGYALHVADLKALIEGLKLEKVHLVGHSYGAVVALGFARDHPELLRKLVVVEPGISDPIEELPEALPEFQNAGAAVKAVKEKLAAGDTATAVQLLMDWAHGPNAFENLPAFVRTAMLENGPSLVTQFGAKPAPFAFGCDDLKRLSMPTLSIEGERSPKMRHLIGDAMEKCLPNGKRVRLPGSHGTPYESPEAFNRAVLEFLASR